MNANQGTPPASAPITAIDQVPPDTELGTLIEEFAKSETGIYISIQQAARQSVVQAQAALEKATKAKADAAADLAKLQAADASIRQQLQAVATPDAAIALSKQLTDSMIDLRHQDGAIAEAEEAFQLASKEMEHASAAASDADQLLATARAYQEDTESTTKERNKWKADLSGRLATLRDDAKAALTSPLYMEARDRVDGPTGNGGESSTSAAPATDEAPGVSTSEWGNQAASYDPGPTSEGTEVGDGDEATDPTEGNMQTPPSEATDEVPTGETATETATPVGPEIPVALRTRARARRKAEVDRRRKLWNEYKEFEDAFEVEEAKDGHAGKVEVARRALAAAERILRWYVGTAKERYDRALELLAPIAAAPPLAEPIPTDPEISEAQRDEEAFEELQASRLDASIQEDETGAAAQVKAQTAVSSPGPAAGSDAMTAGFEAGEAVADTPATGGDPSSAIAPSGPTRDTVLAATKALEDARADLASVTGAFVAANPGKDPTVDPTVKAADAKVKAKEQDLLRARANYLEKARPLDEWEVAVPDEAWRRLADFDEATAILCSLTTDSTGCPDWAPEGKAPAEMLLAVDQTERALVDALAAEASSFRTRRIYRLHAQKYHDKWSAAARSGPARGFSALRGDS